MEVVAGAEGFVGGFLAFATLLAAAPRRVGTLGKLNLSPIAQALTQKPEAA